MTYIDYLTETINETNFSRKRISRMVRVVTDEDLKCTLDGKCTCGKLLTYGSSDNVNLSAKCECGHSFNLTPFGVERILTHEKV